MQLITHSGRVSTWRLKFPPDKPIYCFPVDPKAASAEKYMFSLTISPALRLRMVRLFGTLFLPDDAAALHERFDRDAVAMLHRCTANQTGAAAIDDESWHDLLLDQYADHLAPQVSIFGQQVLHQRLRGGLGHADCVALGERLRALQHDPALLTSLRAECQPLRRADTEMSALLFGAQAPAAPPAWRRCLPLIPLTFFLSLALLVWSQFAWLGVGLALFFLLALQITFSEQIEQWERAMASLQWVLRVASVLGLRASKTDAPLIAGFAAGRARAGQVNRALTRWPMIDLVPGMRAYLDWFALDNLRHYFNSVTTLLLHRDFLRECYLLCANLEADLALARHLTQTPVLCWAERVDGHDIALAGMVHPLLAQAAPLSIALHGKGAFISGQNGIGKSTLLRSLGLNLIAARAFGFCYATSARVPLLPVYASMQNEDSLLGGESLYMAELRRAHTLLASSQGPQRGIYLIDEIFRGTNHLESISAAAAVLHTLAASSPVIVSSHNLVLAALLEDCLTPLCVRLSDHGQLTLAPGVLADTNGITLLAARGFDAQITAKAGKVFDWLGTYLTHPDDCGRVLAA
jgi:hypothetical protein